MGIYILWKNKPVKVTDFNVIRDSDDVYVCTNEHVKFLQTFLRSNAAIQASSSSITCTSTEDGVSGNSKSEGAMLKRKRSHLGKSTEERLSYHESHINDSTYNCSQRRFEPADMFSGNLELS